jgi:phosphonoacetaldehyde hydrolase
MVLSTWCFNQDIQGWISMAPFIRKTTYSGPLRAVVLDWAGTAVDYGCLGPAAVFVDAFREFNVTVSLAEVRQFMGLMKKDHLRRLCNLPGVAIQWQTLYGHLPEESDIEALYACTEPMMVAAISRHADLIPGLLPFVEEMHQKEIRIGTSTGYMRSMMDILVPAAHRNGYHPDAVVCSSDVPAGRPHPWMCYLNAIQLQVYPLQAMVKIGDTVSDIEEGINAGMWTIGVTKSGNSVGLSLEDINRLDPAELSRRLRTAEESLRKAGAHYTVEGIWEALPIIEAIQARLSAGELP